MRAKWIKIQELSEAKGLVSSQITWPLLSSIYSLSSGEARAVKESACNAVDMESIPGLGRSPTPVFLPGESPWIEEPGGLQFMRSQRVGRDWATKHSTCQAQQLRESALAAGSTFCPLPLFPPGLTTCWWCFQSVPHRCLVTSVRTWPPRCQASGKLMPHTLAAGSLAPLVVISLSSALPHPRSSSWHCCCWSEDFYRTHVTRGSSVRGAASLGWQSEAGGCVLGSIFWEGEHLNFMRPWALKPKGEKPGL